MTKEIVTPIFQFGTSRFLQAHAALFVHEALAAGDASGPDHRHRQIEWSDRELWHFMLGPGYLLTPMNRRPEAGTRAPSL